MGYEIRASDVTTPTLADFLLARIAEDERHWGNPALVRLTGPDLSALVLRARAECEAKRAIVKWCVALIANPWEMGPILNHLALPYADHPDYNPTWRP